MTSIQNIRIDGWTIEIGGAIEADSDDLTSAWCEEEDCEAAALEEAEADPELAEDDAEDWSEGLSCCIAAGFSSGKRKRVRRG